MCYGACSALVSPLPRGGDSGDVGTYRVSRDARTHGELAVSAILRLSPFPREGKGFGVKVETPHYGKEG